jgi:hypothetical protein
MSHIISCQALGNEFILSSGPFFRSLWTKEMEYKNDLVLRVSINCERLIATSQMSQASRSYRLSSVSSEFRIELRGCLLLQSCF